MFHRGLFLVLFLVFINDLGSVLQKSSYKLYADDTVIYTDYTKTDTENVVSDLQADLTNLDNWCRMNEIWINMSKSKSMAFGTRYQVKHYDPPNVTLGNIGLEIVPHYKYLGPFVDTHLTFTKQAAETCKSVSFKLYCLSKIKKYLDTDSMIQLYKAYIQPYFDNNDIFNSTSTSYYQNKLIKLHQRCLRNCLPATRKYEKLELHILTGVNSLKDRAKNHLLKIMYKRSRLTYYLNNDPRPTRAFNGPILDVPFPNNELLKKSVLYRGSTFWNDTNPLDRNIATFHSYKIKLKKDLKLKLLAN